MNGITMHFKNNSILHAASKILFCMMTMAVCAQSSAKDAFWEYVADLHLHESHQARNHRIIISYSDPENGELLKKVLEPKQAIPMLAQYFDSIIHQKDDVNLVQLLMPVVARYEKPFMENPKVYEAEYLDGLEISTYLSMRLMSLSHATSDTPATNRSALADSSDKKALMESLQKLGNSAVGAFTQATAKSVREKIAKNMFTPAGALHATQFAESLESLNDASAKDNLRQTK